MEVKHHSKKLGIMILIGFLLIVIGIISYIVINYNDDQAEVRKRMEAVRDSYEASKTDVESFNSIRDNIYTEVMQDMYYETLKNNDARYKELFNSYEEALKTIDKDYNKIEDKCVNVLHPKADVNNKCEAMIEGYEEVVNTYISDVESYNKNIKAYNNYLKENNSTDKALEEIKLDRDYLDVNGDREYLGKVDVKEEIKSNENNDDGVTPDE